MKYYIVIYIIIIIAQISPKIKQYPQKKLLCTNIGNSFYYIIYRLANQEKGVAILLHLNKISSPAW